jgi:membrane protein
MSSPDIRESSPPAPADAPTGDLVSRASEQLSTLVRDEIRLAQAELAQKGRRAGLGIGLFGGAGAIAWFGAGTFVAAAVLGLAVVVSPWLSAVIVGAVLLAIAGILALIGKREVTRATPITPQESLDSVRHDVDAVKKGLHRERP